MPQRKPLADRLRMPGHTPPPDSLGTGGVTATPNTGTIRKIQGPPVAPPFSPTTTGTHHIVKVPRQLGATTSGSIPKVRKRHKPLPRSGWIPDQHGAWAMVLVPFWCGALWSSVRPTTFVLFATWFAAYFCFFAGTQWLKSGRRERYWPPVRAYGLLTLLFGLITALLAPPLLEWCIVLLPLFIITLWQTWKKNDRSLLTRSVTVLVSGIMCLVTYDLGTGFSRSQLHALWLQHAPADPSAAIEAAPVHSELTGWGWIAFLTFWLTMYFWAAVPYVKTLVRERGSRGYLAFSLTLHAILAGCAWVSFAVNWCTVFVPIMWTILLIRAAAMPAWSAKTGKRIKPSIIGRSELVLMILVVLALNL